jgi:D-galactose 1-dehydrogenase
MAKPELLQTRQKTASSRSAETDINIGLVGYGNIGREAHARVLTGNHKLGFLLMGVTDPALTASPKNGIKLYPSNQAMFDDPAIEAVSIATPPHLHKEQVIDALNKGKHVVIEKPPALSLDDLMNMNQAAIDNKRVLFTAFHARYGASAVEASRLLKGITIKKVEIDYAENVGRYHNMQKGWILNKDINGGGVLMDSGINALSLVAAVIPEQFTNLKIKNAQLSRPDSYQDPRSGDEISFTSETRAVVEFSFGENGDGKIQQEWLHPDDKSERRLVRFITNTDEEYEVDIIHKTISRNGVTIFDANAGDLTRVDREGEYTGVYKDFAESIYNGESFVESGALQLVKNIYESSPVIHTIPVDVYRRTYPEKLPNSYSEKQTHADKDILTIARIHTRYPGDKVEDTVESITANVTQFGPVLIVSNDTYPHLDKLTDAVAKNGEQVIVDIYNGSGKDHGGMFNKGINAAKEAGLPFFATVSNDLMHIVPDVFPIMLARLKENPELTSVGLAILGIHDTELLNRIKNGEAKITASNYPGIFINNAFALHRVEPVSSGKPVPFTDRLFLQHKRSDGELLGRHEDIEIALRLLNNGSPTKNLLLAFTGNWVASRNHAEEVPSAGDKNKTRKNTAKYYQQLYGLSDNEIESYLENHFGIEFIE